nr:hypothetical protein [Tanacetum cinerariifolium]
MDNKELTVFPTCGISRWKVENKTHKLYENILEKVMWYFSIIPRLQQLFKLESISDDLRCHATRRITDGVLRHPIDSQAWRTIDEKFLEIAKDLRNLRLGIPADGVEVNSGTRHHKFVDDMDFDIDFGLEIPTNGPATVEMVNATKESFDEDDLSKFQELLLDAEKPLYKRCPDFTKLSAIVKLLNLKGKYGASDKLFTELLGLLKKMLPAGNKMVEK